MLKHARRLHRAGDELWRGVRAADRSKATERVAALRQRYPSAHEATLHKHLVRSKCIQAGIVGALSSATGMLPGVGRFIGTALGPLADAGIVTTLQAELVVETFVLYDMRLPVAAEQAAVVTIAAANLGTKEVGRAVAAQLERALARNVAGRLLARALPLANIATSAATNVALTYAVGQRAQALARMKDARLDEWPELMRQLTQIDERKLTELATSAAKRAVGAMASSAASWRERLTALLPDAVTVEKPKRLRKKPAQARPRARKRPARKRREA